MTAIALGKGYYHLQREMIDWCYKNIGDGDWNDSHLLDEKQYKWSVTSAFGNTFFQFRRDRDAMLFSLKWM